MTADMLGRTALYRLYAADGTLLYVGVTDDLGRRFRDHSRDKSWWQDVDGKMIWFYDERGEAEEAETAAICGEDPVHNVRGTPRYVEVILAAQERAAGKYDRTTADWPSWAAVHIYPRKCNWCGAQLVAATDDPDVFIACPPCHDFYGVPAHLKESA